MHATARKQTCTRRFPRRACQSAKQTAIRLSGSSHQGTGRFWSRRAHGPCAASPKADAITAAGLCILLFGVVTWTFLPAIHNGFLGYDDDLFVTAYPYAQSGMTWHSVGWALRNPVVGIWHPLTLLSHMLDCQTLRLEAVGAPPDQHAAPRA